MEKKDEKMIPASAALIPFAVLLLMLFFVIRYFGSSALEGASQVALLVASAVCGHSHACLQGAVACA